MAVFFDWFVIDHTDDQARTQPEISVKTCHAFCHDMNMKRQQSGEVHTASELSHLIGENLTGRFCHGKGQGVRIHGPLAGHGPLSMRKRNCDEKRRGCEIGTESSLSLILTSYTNFSARKYKI